mmetsp:Transcript_59943/g.128649  ORF Transcript_59943/g.128649 Transcript_59943/m.128649 type:complete len:474 (+) Transcript_59943:45-1466(+)
MAPPPSPGPADVTLERDLEQIIEAEVEEELLPLPPVKRPRRSTGPVLPIVASEHAAGSPVAAAATALPLHGKTAAPRPSLDELMECWEAQHAAVRGQFGDATACRDRRAEDLQHAERMVQEACAAVASAEGQVLAMEKSASSAQETLAWLVDVHTAVQKAQAKQVFHGSAKESFNAAVRHLSETHQLQNGSVQEAVSSLQAARKAHERCCRERGELEKAADQARELLSRAEEQAKVIQLRAEQWANQAYKVRQMRQEVQELAQVVEAAEGELSEATHQRRAREAELTAFRAWSEDLRLFFQGKGVRDADAIHKGMQDVMGPGDLLPGIVGAMISHSSGTLQSANDPCVGPMRDLAIQSLRDAEARLNAQLATAQASHAECERKRDEAEQRWLRQEMQLRGFLAESLPVPAKAVASVATAGRLKRVATPLGNFEASCSKAPMAAVPMAALSTSIGGVTTLGAILSKGRRRTMAP